MYPLDKCPLAPSVFKPLFVGSRPSTSFLLSMMSSWHHPLLLVDFTQGSYLVYKACSPYRANQSCWRRSPQAVSPSSPVRVPQRPCPPSSSLSCPYRCPLVAIVHLARVPSSYPLIVFVRDFSARRRDPSLPLAISLHTSLAAPVVSHTWDETHPGLEPICSSLVRTRAREDPD